MIRHDWKFEHTASTLAVAAKAKRTIHDEKRAWWEDKKSEVMKRVRESGIEREI